MPESLKCLFDSMRLICSKGKKKKIKRERAELVNDLRDRGQEGLALAVWALQRRGGTEGCLARALESGECSREWSAVSCLVSFWGGERHDGESFPQPNPVPLILLPLGQCVPALPPPCLSAAGLVILDWSRGVQCSMAWGEETGQGNALQQKLEGLNMSPMLCAGVGHSGIFSLHLPFALADWGEAAGWAWRGYSQVLLSSISNTARLSWGVLVHRRSTSHPPSHMQEACLQAAAAACGI